MSIRIIDEAIRSINGRFAPLDYLDRVNKAVVRNDLLKPRRMDRNPFFIHSLSHLTANKIKLDRVSTSTAYESKAHTLLDIAIAKGIRPFSNSELGFLHRLLDYCTTDNFDRLFNHENVDYLENEIAKIYGIENSSSEFAELLEYMEQISLGGIQSRGDDAKLKQAFPYKNQLDYLFTEAYLFVFTVKCISPFINLYDSHPSMRELFDRYKSFHSRYRSSYIIDIKPYTNTLLHGLLPNLRDYYPEDDSFSPNQINRILSTMWRSGDRLLMDLANAIDIARKETTNIQEQHNLGNTANMKAPHYVEAFWKIGGNSNTHLGIIHEEMSGIHADLYDERVASSFYLTLVRSSNLPNRVSKFGRCYESQYFVS